MLDHHVDGDKTWQTHCRLQPWNTTERPESRYTVKPSAVVMSPVEAGFASMQTEANASAKDATASEVSVACTANCTEGIPECHFLG